jgi:hypothetical protein
VTIGTTVGGATGIGAVGVGKDTGDKAGCGLAGAALITAGVQAR